MNLFSIKKALLTTFFVVSSCSVNAGIISFTDSWNFSSSTLRDREGGSDAVRSASDTLNFEGFDASLGTLTSVSLSFQSNWSYNSSISAVDKVNHFYDEVKGSGMSTTSWRFSLADPLGSSQVTHSDSEFSACSDSGNSYLDRRCTQYESNKGSFDGLLNLSAIDLNSWIIPVGDNVSVSLLEKRTAKVYSCGSDDDCYQYNYNNKWKGLATLTYTYNEVVASSTEIPEPASLALFALGIIGLASRRYKK